MRSVSTMNAIAAGSNSARATASFCRRWRRHDHHQGDRIELEAVVLAAVLLRVQPPDWVPRLEIEDCVAGPLGLRDPRRQLLHYCCTVRREVRLLWNAAVDHACAVAHVGRVLACAVTELREEALRPLRARLVLRAVAIVRRAIGRGVAAVARVVPATRPCQGARVSQAARRSLIWRLTHSCWVEFRTAPARFEPRAAEQPPSTRPSRGRAPRRRS
eukprot:COSAG04_NODE_1345_length_7143_cov_1.712663_3_plen_216_part_00